MWALGSGIKGIAIPLLAKITRTNQLPRFGLKLQEQVIALVRNERFPSTFNCSPLFLQCLWKTNTTENTAGKVSKYGVFFWSVFSRIRIEHVPEKTPYLDLFHAELTGTIRCTSKEKIYEELGLDSLRDQRRVRKLCLFYKVLENENPRYLSSLIPTLVIHNLKCT